MAWQAALIAVGAWLLRILPELIHLGIEAGHIYHFYHMFHPESMIHIEPPKCLVRDVSTIPLLDENLRLSLGSLLSNNTLAKLLRKPQRKYEDTIYGFKRVMTIMPMAQPCFLHHSSSSSSSNISNWDHGSCSNNGTCWRGKGWNGGGLDGTTTGAYSNVTCLDVQEHYHENAYRRRLMSGYAWDTSAMCLSDPRQQCLLDDRNVYDRAAYAEGKPCAQGVIPTEGFGLMSDCDAQLAFAHSRTTGRPLVIKNTGFDYLGRSAGKGALMVWTRPQMLIEHKHDGKKNRTVVTIEAGTTCGEAYEYGFKHNLTILCGSSPSIALSGGWLLAGGYSVLSNKYGMGVDRVKEYSVILPDGKVLDVKEKHPRGKREEAHFWALNGAGAGGAFGLVLSSRFVAEPLFPVVIADIRFKSTSLRDTLDWVRLLSEEAVAWSHAGWGGHVVGTRLAYITAMQNVTEAKAMLWRASAFARARGGSATITAHATWEPYYRRYIARNNHTAGGSGLVTSRLIGSADIDEKIGQDLMVSYFEELLRNGDGQVYIDATTPVNFVQKRDVSLSDAWRRSVWHVRSFVPLHNNYTLEQRKAAVRKLNRYTRLLKEISPATGTYSAEANMFDKDWRHDYWGHEKYAKLLSFYEKDIRRPEQFNMPPCRRCIGWNEAMVSSCTKGFENLGEL